MRKETKIVKMAKKLGFQVYLIKENDPNMAGFIIISNSLKKQFGTKAVMAINEKLCSSVTASITIANLIVHYLIDSPSKDYVYVYNPFDLTEKTYNSLAVNLLYDPDTTLEKLQKF